MRLVGKSLSPPSRKEDEMIHHSRDSFRRMRWDEKREQCHFISPRDTHTHRRWIALAGNRITVCADCKQQRCHTRLQSPYLERGLPLAFSITAFFHDVRANGINRRSGKLWGETIQIWAGGRIPGELLSLWVQARPPWFCCWFWAYVDVISALASFPGLVCCISKAKTIIMTGLIGSICAKLIRRPLSCGFTGFHQ